MPGPLLFRHGLVFGFLPVVHFFPVVGHFLVLGARLGRALVGLLGGPRTPAHPGAAAGSFSGGLIPEGKDGSAAALTIPHGPRLRAWGQRASK